MGLGWDCGIFFLEGLKFSILELDLFCVGSYGELGGLFIVVGSGGRIWTVDCSSRVLNVNGSLYGSTSRCASAVLLFAGVTFLGSFLNNSTLKCRGWGPRRSLGFLRCTVLLTAAGY